MNILYSAFCRVYQTAFRLALPILPYREPKFLSSVEDTVNELKALGKKLPLLVTDKGLRSSGATEKLEELLREQGIACKVYDNTGANPTVDNVEAARRVYIDGECDSLIAFGGGSPIDCAKAVGARLVYPNKPLGKLKGILRVNRRLPTLIAIPTTAGTGSETTVTAVITDSEKKHKYTINSFPLIPSHAVLDPEVTYSLPPHLTATTGMDALTHAVEAYIGRSTTKETRALATDAVKLIFANIETAYSSPHCREARAAMLEASYKAGRAFSMSYVGYIHAIAHSLGGEYGIPHGLANSVLLPILLEEYGTSVHKKLHRLAVVAGVAEVDDTHEAAASKFIDAIKELNRRMNIPECFDTVKDEDIPHMARHAAKEANPLYPVPKLMNARELEKMYYKVAVRK